jgi:hypothetical protein
MTTALRPEQIKAREYLEQKGTRLPAAQVRERVAAALVRLEETLASASGAEAGRRPEPGKWSVHEIVDHLVQTHRPSIDELRDLLAGRRPAGLPIPAGLVSADPLARPWPDLVAELRRLHAEALDALDGATDAIGLDARAPIVMVINAREPDGREAPVHWIEELDWKAYAVSAFRLHTLDHRAQVVKALDAIRGAACPDPRR